ncbi:multicopper oxidase [Lecanosticta acicola]|uniref:Multicopper oxidase n=1 Tax=Lecanosticta acicola TaxID=111012 RepID=A0AAI9ECA6_9PEZI|nr:multicopper oxidase [Lecanosticta acicola]
MKRLLLKTLASAALPLLVHTFRVPAAIPQAAAPPPPQLLPRQDDSSTGSCSGNTASDRSVWCDYDLSTNYYDEVPDTGVTREYWFDITNSTLAPNGVDRIVLSVNGSVPGPTIIADWGDEVVVHVTNSLSINGSTIHWHGVRQNWTNDQDGVPSITQCPTIPGDTTTYRWRATQYGSSWYHSHYSLQAWDGVFGGILINGPAAGNYDVDLGVLFLNDWDAQTASAKYSYAQTEGPPTLDTGLINGTNTNNSLGSRWETSVESGSSYLLRVVNGAVDTHFDFMVDNHTLTVIAMDFVPITPYTAETISIGMGQRYDVILTANQSSVASDFWLRAIPDDFCSDNYNGDDIKGIIHYGTSTGTPTTSAPDYDAKSCYGEPAASLVPYLSQTASSSGSLSSDLAVTIGLNSANLFKWYIGGTTFAVDMADPSALQIIEDNATVSWSTSSGVISLPTADEWAIVIIETTTAVPHPIHLHGHDFFQLAQGTGTYASAAPTLNVDNPPRRDVTILPASGYVVIAFQADNPGVWLCHCHIGWHTEEGFALQFVERESEIAGLYNSTDLESGCAAWTSFSEADSIEDDGSGV